MLFSVCFHANNRANRIQIKVPVLKQRSQTFWLFTVRELWSFRKVLPGAPQWNQVNAPSNIEPQLLLLQLIIIMRLVDEPFIWYLQRNLFKTYFIDIWQVNPNSHKHNKCQTHLLRKYTPEGVPRGCLILCRYADN